MPNSAILPAIKQFIPIPVLKPSTFKIDDGNGDVSDFSITLNGLARLAAKAGINVGQLIAMPNNGYLGDRLLAVDGQDLLLVAKNDFINFPAWVADKIKAAFSSGDPHLVSFDGMRFDFQKPGEYFLVDSKTKDFLVQIREQLVPGSTIVSANTAVATDLDDVKVGIYTQLLETGRLEGTSGNDVLTATKNTTLILGGADSGQVVVAATDDVTFVSASSGYNNSFGYYVKDDAGYPYYGQIIWSNTHNVTVGNGFNYTLTISQDHLGFFLITNGSACNADLSNGNHVAFEQVNGNWAVFKNGVALKNAYTGTATEAHAFYSDIALNADHIQHQHTSDNQQGWEELYNGGDQSFNDLVINTFTSDQVVSIITGDTLIASSGPDHFGYVMGKDGVDRIKEFNATEDLITFFGGNVSNIKFTPFGNGTFIRTMPTAPGVAGGILVENIDAGNISLKVVFDRSTATQRSNLYIADEEVQMNFGELKAVGYGFIYYNGEYTVITGNGDGFTASFYDNRRYLNQ